MSIDFVSVKPIDMAQLRSFDFNGVNVDLTPDNDSVILTDGTNFFWATETSDVLFGGLDENGQFQVENEGRKGILFTNYMGNRPEKIIDAVEICFDTKLISENDEAFLNFITYD